MENEKLTSEMIELIEQFKSKLSIAAEETIGNLYVDIAAHVETDTMYNFKNEILRGLKNYSHAKEIYKHDYKAIRAEMLKEHKAEIIADLNKDLISDSEFWKKEYNDLLDKFNNNRH